MLELACSPGQEYFAQISPFWHTQSTNTTLRGVQQKDGKVHWSSHIDSSYHITYNAIPETQVGHILLMSIYFLPPPLKKTTLSWRLSWSFKCIHLNVMHLLYSKSKLYFGARKVVCRKWFLFFLLHFYHQVG